MPRFPAPFLWPGLLLVACAGPSLQWRDAPRPEDPAPSGPAYLREYKEAHYRDLGQRFVAKLSVDDLLARVAAQRVLFLGDHHTDVALHGRWSGLLDALVLRGVDLTLGVEAVGMQDELEVSWYLDGDLGLDKLRRRVAWRWPESWLDSGLVDAPFYRGLLERARQASLPVFALEPVPRLPLEQRDAVMAARIRRAAARHPDRLVVVVVGHTHLLGQGRLVDRVGLPSVVLGARMSVSLRQEAVAFAPADAGVYLVADSGVVFFWSGAAAVSRSRGPSATS